MERSDIRISRPRASRLSLRSSRSFAGCSHEVGGASMKPTTLPIPPPRCELINESGPRHSGSRLLLLPPLAIRIDHFAGLVLGRPQDQLLAAGAELLEVIGHDVLKLSEELARFRPLAVLAECD